MPYQNRRNFNTTKGYELVRILRGGQNIAPTNYIEIYKENLFTGIISLKARVVQHFSVTSGFWKDIQISGKRVHVMTIYRDGQGRVVIPGSSIKGMLRHYVRVLSERTSKDNRDDDSGMPEAIFGSTSFRSRVRSTDVIYEGSLKGLRIFQQYAGHSRNNFYKVYSLTKKEEKGSRPEFLVEIIPKGSILEFVLSVEGLKGIELGVLFLAMGVHPNYRFCLKFGRGKNIGMGGLLMEVTRFERDKGLLGKEVYEGAKLDELIKKAASEYLNFVRNRAGVESNLKVLMEDSQKIVKGASSNG